MQAQAQPQSMLPPLECDAQYSIFQWRRVFQADPVAVYDTPASELGGRFRIKVMAFSRQSAADTLKIQVSYWDGRQFSIMQDTTYGPDFIRTVLKSDGELTGEQRLYSPDLGRQLLYRCRFLLGQGTP